MQFSRENKVPVITPIMNTSRLERKINEDPLAWGSAEMVRLAKQRIKAGKPAALAESSDTGKPAALAVSSDTGKPAALVVSSDTGTASEAPVKVTPSKISASNTKQKPELVENKNWVESFDTSPYPKIRAKYDLLIANVMSSKSSTQRDKKARVKNLEFRYDNEIQEKKYQKCTLWCLAGFLVVTASIWYAKLSFM